jgi:hypothetical protein
MRWTALLVGLACASSCFSPTYPSGVQCGPGGECPPGQECGAGNVCGAPALPDAGGPVPDVLGGGDACVAGGAELCNGADDDCDGMMDEDFSVGGACDSAADADDCADDVYVCAADQTGVDCEDVVGAPTERCDDVDNDCDGMNNEDWPELGAVCDGADTDLCDDDALQCNATQDGTECSTGDDDIELCNGLDDDCDGSSDEDFALGASCDGPDGDLCEEGFVICGAAGDAECSDATGEEVEICNFADEDCDGEIDEDFDLSNDVDNCGSCGLACTNAYGSTACASGVCVPMCDAGSMDCDGDPADGCELLNTSPSCGSALLLGLVAGDNPDPGLMTSGYAEAWYRVTIHEEDSVSFNPLTAMIVLSNPPGVDFDLFVRCAACTSSAMRSSTLGAGLADSVSIGRDDIPGASDFDLFIEVRYVSATACGEWMLDIVGDVATSDRTCN